MRDTLCTDHEIQRDTETAIGDLGNIRDEYTHVSFAKCEGNQASFLVLSITTVNGGDGDGEIPFYKKKIFIYASAGGAGFLLLIVAAVICFVVGKRYQSKKSKRWLNNYERRMV